MRIWYKGENGDRGECDVDIHTDEYEQLKSCSDIVEMGIVDESRKEKELLGEGFEAFQIVYSMRSKEDKDLDMIHWIEKKLIIMALEASDWRQNVAALKLRIPPRTINYRIRQYGICHSSWRANRPECAILSIR